MSTKRNQAPHEGLFLKIFQNLDNARHFLKKHMSEELQKRFDLDTLRLEPTTYVDEKLKKHYSDLVFSVRLIGYKNQFAKIYLLFEHKSSPDPLTGVQVLKYMALQWLDLQEQHMLVDGKLPPIIPIVIYQGQEDDRNMCSSFHDLVEMPSESFKVYIPDFSFAFFNVRGMDEAKVREKILLKFYVEIIKYQNDPSVKEIPPRLVRGLIESLGYRTALEYIEIFFRYLVKSTGYLSQEDYKKALELLPEGGESIMETLADQWMEQGAQKERHRAEEWIKQEKDKWERQAELKNAKETLIDVAGDCHGPLPKSLQDKIKSIDSIDNLRTLTRKVYKTQSLEEFTELVNRATQH
ncbi:putative transposase YhgA family protein [Desulfonatronospira thiodismutans ASO3-1]|uniref:Transposase YhgA family protein n=1 Tax=Desulfonatronospira thiodismutans ASO3-1 TaxID=555779 RepID=D6SV09_9BACT|nr:Rpn family recombination-promoting nuclease/putative transposase [Desulfonatronospira thiodismutans]EFI32765.1 putative transposase YhgA family protein [Desulfonatronospira thiodismutans ASO3-1]